MKTEKYSITKQATIFETLIFLNTSKRQVIKLYIHSDRSKLKSLVKMICRLNSIKYRETYHEHLVRAVLLDGLNIQNQSNQTIHDIKNSGFAAQSSGVITTSEALKALSDIIRKFSKDENTRLWNSF